MNPAQEKFREFILELVKEDSKGKASDMLMEVFQKQKDNSLSKQYLTSLLPKLMPLLKPEYKSQLQSFIFQYATGAFRAGDETLQ